MTRKYELTWFKPRKCWTKVYRGKRYYFGTKGKCKGKTDIDGYYTALDEWYRKKYEVSGVPQFLRDIIDDQYRPSTRAGLVQSIAPPPPIPGEATAIAFANDYKGRPRPEKISDAVGVKTIAGLVQNHLDQKRSDADAGITGKKTVSDNRALLEDFVGYAVDVYEATDIDQVDGDLLAGYRTEQLRLIALEKKEGGVSQYTALHRLQAVKRFLEWCVKSDALEQRPNYLISGFTKIKIDRPTPTFYSPAEIKQLYVVASPLLKASILLGLNAGYTQADVSTVKWEMIDRQTRIISRPRNKTGVLQQHKLWPVTLATLQNVSTSESGLILTHNGQELIREEFGKDNKLLRYDQIVLEMRKAKRKLKWTEDKRGFKTLRKTGANEIAKEYQHTEVIYKMWLAHELRGIAKHYVEPHFDEVYKACDYLATVYNLPETK